MANFCTATPQAPPCDPALEFGRHTQTLPWSDWTLELQAATIIGLYSNVPSDGHFETSQTDWMAAQLGNLHKLAKGASPAEDLGNGAVFE